MSNHKEVCLSINGTQSVTLEKRRIKFKNLFKQILVPFKIYSNFECILTSAESHEGSRTEKYQNHIPCSFAYKLAMLMLNLASQLLFTEVKVSCFKFIKATLKEYEYCRKVMKKHFNKNLIVTKEEKHFQSCSTCWICKKLIEHEKARDCWHITGEIRGAGH